MQKSHKSSLLRLLAPSLVAIGACLVCLCGLSWALFTSEISTGVNTIQSASFAVAVEVSVEVESSVTQQPLTEELSAAELDADEEEPAAADTATSYTSIRNENGTYTVVLPAGNTYVLTIIKIGTATTGHCLISINDNTTYCTAIINDEEEYTLKITPAEEMTITITPTWGPVPEGVETLASGYVIGEPTKEEIPPEDADSTEDDDAGEADPTDSVDSPENSTEDAPPTDELIQPDQNPPTEDSQQEPSTGDPDRTEPEESESQDDSGESDMMP